MSISANVTKSEWGRLAQQARAVADGTLSKETAEAVLDDAKGRVHVISGKTRDSGRVVKSGIGYDVMFEEGAIFEEYGTRYRPPHPFLTPAAEAQRGPYLERLKKALE